MRLLYLAFLLPLAACGTSDYSNSSVFYPEPALPDYHSPVTTYPAQVALRAKLQAMMVTQDIQRALNSHGAYPVLVVDGIPGVKTTAAIQAFQVRHNIPVDGLAVKGSPTWDALGL